MMRSRRTPFRLPANILIILTVSFIGVTETSLAQSCATPNTSQTRYVDCNQTTNGNGLSWETAWNKIRTAAQNVGNGTKVLVRGACSEVNDIRIQGTDIWFQADQPVTITRGGSPHDGFRIVGPSTRVMIDGKNENTKFVLQGNPGRFNEGVLVAQDPDVPGTESVSDITLKFVEIVNGSTHAGFVVTAPGDDICFIDTLAQTGTSQNGNGYVVNVPTTVGSLTGLEFIRARALGNERDGFAISHETATGVSGARWLQSRAEMNRGDGFDVDGAGAVLLNISSNFNGVPGSNDQGRGVTLFAGARIENAHVIDNRLTGIRTGPDTSTIVASTLVNNDRNRSGSDRTQISVNSGTVQIYDTIAATDEGRSVHVVSGSASCGYNLFNASFTSCGGSNNISDDPVFQSGASLTAGARTFLAGTSPGIDEGIDPRTPLTGIELAWSQDHDQRCRPRDGNGDGSFGYDIGAFESGSACPAVGTPTPTPGAAGTRTHTFTHRPTRTPRPPTSTPTRTGTPTRTPTFPLPCPEPVCVCDCNCDDDVTISELITSVGIALGNNHVSLCLSADENSDARVSISEITSGVNNSLGGCGAGLRSSSALAVGDGGQPIDGVIEDVPAVTLEIPAVFGLPGGAVRISLILNGQAEACGGMNVDVAFPENVLLDPAKCELAPRLAQSHELAIARLSNNKLRLLLINTNTFPAPSMGDGLVVQCEALLAADAAAGDYAITPSRFNVSDPFGDPLIPEIRAGMLTVTSQ